MGKSIFCFGARVGCRLDVNNNKVLAEDSNSIKNDVIEI